MYNKNMKFKEIRHYPNDNKNIVGKEFISAQDFKKIFELIFPEWEVLLAKDNNEYLITSVIERDTQTTKLSKEDNPSLFNNKAYICFKEVNINEYGLSFYFHDGYGAILSELYNI